MTISAAGEGVWRQRGEEAADALFRMMPDMTAGGALRRVILQFDIETFRQELVDAAREAFLARWAGLRMDPTPTG